MDLARILNQGVGSWLHFEYCCNRSGMFNEKYLSYSIGQLLNSRYNERIHAEFLHPVLAPAMKGRGRRPQVDFAYCEQYPNVMIAVETKWIGNSKVSVEDLIWDLIRLEMISAVSGVECIFMLGGKRKNLEAFFQSEKFSGPQNSRPLIYWKNNNVHKLPIVPNIPHRVSLLKKVFEGTPNIDYPQAIKLRRTTPYPEDCKLREFQVYSWAVSSMVNRTTFRAKESPHYR